MKEKYIIIISIVLLFIINGFVCIYFAETEIKYLKTRIEVKDIIIHEQERLIDKSCKITVPILPFSAIDKAGAGMYKGEKITQAERHNKE